MSAVAFTPNVRSLVVCDEDVASEIEAEVFTLEGARHRVEIDTFPHQREVSVFLQLAYARGGSFNGSVRLVRVAPDRELRRVSLQITFSPGEQFIATTVSLGICTFPAPSLYHVQVWFWDHTGQEAQKAERPFFVVASEAE